jgi:cyclopropane-fatty-acyl-phospholipid synthase
MASQYRVPSEGFVASSGAERRPGAVGAAQAESVSAYARLLRAFLRAMGNPAVRVDLWNGESVCPAASDPVASIRIRQRGTLLRLIFNPEVEFGEAYTSGNLEVEGDLVQLLKAAYGAPVSPWVERLLRRSPRPRPNTPHGARSNIHHHYDLGNDFYRLWLDDHMVYTCAYFASPAMSLEAAQIAKMEHVCRKVVLRPGERVVEAGCGWGALALHMAERHGVSVRAFNISREQIAYAREQAKKAGLAGRVDFIEDDYRNISGSHDVFVSVGMLEHVGTAQYRELGRVMDRCLLPHGRGLLHTIGRNRPARLNAWVQKHIFPGAHPPTLREMMDIFEPSGFSVLDVENLRLHYARTLEHWLVRFERSAQRVARMFDDAFVRAWRLYLAGSIAAFATGSLQLFQVSFARPRHNDIPWTRAHLYTDQQERDRGGR